MPSYNRLTGDNRIELYALKKAGLTQEAIAAQRNDLNLSRISAAPSFRLGHLLLEGDRAFPTQC